MKTLVLLRHAKSSWALNVDDRHRPLTEKGIRRIKKVTLECPDVFSGACTIFSSPANRAFHTASIMMYSLQLNFNKLNLVEDLYTFEVSKLVYFIQNLSDSLNSVVCVGHNPAFTQAIEYLSGSDFAHLPTSGWAQLTFSQNSWTAISKGTLKVGIPKKLLK